MIHATNSNVSQTMILCTGVVLTFGSREVEVPKSGVVFYASHMYSGFRGGPERPREGKVHCRFLFTFLLSSSSFVFVGGTGSDVTIFIHPIGGSVHERAH